MKFHHCSCPFCKKSLLSKSLWNLLPRGPSYARKIGPFIFHPSSMICPYCGEGFGPASVHWIEKPLFALSLLAWVLRGPDLLRAFGLPRSLMIPVVVIIIGIDLLVWLRTGYEKIQKIAERTQT